MRYDCLSSATWSSHMDRLVINELERTSQGAFSGPSIWVLILMPFALIRIAEPFVYVIASTSVSAHALEEIHEQPQKFRRRGGRHEMAGGFDQLETGARDLLRQLFRAGRRPHRI